MSASDPERTCQWLGNCHCPPARAGAVHWRFTFAALLPLCEGGYDGKAGYDGYANNANVVHDAARSCRRYESSHLTAPPTPSASIAPKNTEPTTFRTPTWARYFSLISTLILGGISAFMLGFAIFLLFQRWWWVGAFVAAMACFMAGLTGYVLQDLRGKWGLRVELLPDRMVLDLPAGRSLIHRPVAQHLKIPYSDIDAVETRLEAYPSLGMEIMQRAYVLSRKQGDRFVRRSCARDASRDSNGFKDRSRDCSARPRSAS
jgi:hypothetical protein